MANNNILRKATTVTTPNNFNILGDAEHIGALMHAMWERNRRNSPQKESRNDLVGTAYLDRNFRYHGFHGFLGKHHSHVDCTW